MNEYYNGIDLVKNRHVDIALIIEKRNAGKIKYFMQHQNSPMLDFYPDIRESVRATNDNIITEEREAMKAEKK